MTIRQFKLIESLGIGSIPSTGTITMNGTPVFEGTFLNNGTLNELVANGSVYVDNALAINNYIMVPMTMTVTSGQIWAPLFQWNYAQVKNPIYSDEQWAIVSNSESTAAQCLAIYEIVAVPPLSDADKIMLLTTGPDDAAIREDILVAHNLTTYFQVSTQFAYGLTSEVADCNRTNVLLNGVEPPGANTNLGIPVSTGDVFTADFMVFASNLAPNIT